jgi:2-dehydropantoate 2-reductase
VETRAGGGFVVGELGGYVTGRAADVAMVMSACAPTTVSENVTGLRWSKLIWNCMMNPLSALSGLGQGEIILDERTRRLCLAIGAEGVAVSRAAGATLEPLTSMGVDPRRFASRGTELRGVEASLIARYESQIGKSTSMSQDIARGRLTEIDFLNGYLVAHGRRLNVETPMNAVTVELVHRLEQGLVAPRPASLDPLFQIEVRV